MRILPSAPADTRPRTPLISFCTVQLLTICAAHSLATLCLCTTSGPDPGELLGFWGSMVFRHAPIPRKGPGNQQQQHKEALIDLGSFQQKEGLQDVCLGVNLGEAHQVEILNVLGKYSGVFSDLPGKTDLIKHRVELTGNEPIRSKPYPLPYAVR